MSDNALQSLLLNDRNVQIGNICFQWAYLEYLIALTIWSLLHIDPDTGKIVTGGLDIRPRLNMAINLARELQAPKGAIDALLLTREALDKGLDQRRNTAVHGHRIAHPNDPAAELVEVHRGKGARKRRPQTNADLTQLGKDIKQLADDLLDGLNKNCIFETPYSRPARIIAPKTKQTTSGRGSHPSS